MNVKNDLELEKEIASIVNIIEDNRHFLIIPYYVQEVLQEILKR